MTVAGEKQLCPNPKCGAENGLSANVCPKCGTLQRQLLARGTILKGRYRIEAVRGCGGFGAVYRATDLQTGQTVAIKENQRHQTFQRFEQEGKLLMQLSHPNLPTVHEVFIDQTTGRAFLVMDFIDGETLEEMLERLKRPLTWQEAQPILAQVINALNHLHRNKVVHRDIKPSNIIVTKRYETVYDEVDDWEEVTVPPPKLTETQIAAETDDKRFEQGKRLWEQGHLTNLQRDGWKLSGICWSEQAKVIVDCPFGCGRKLRFPNRKLEVTCPICQRSFVWTPEAQREGVTFDGKSYQVVWEILGESIRRSVSVSVAPFWLSKKRNCTCSDFRGRRLCKHLVALLLAWVHEPQRFKVVSEKKERRPIKRQVPRQVERQHVFLVDFGVAKVMEEVDPKRPRSSSIVAWTDGYSPPEQYASGVQVDARADQYALAATMVFALTGKTPDDAFTRMEKFRKGEPTLPPKPDGVPESVWKAIEVAMRFEPSQRFADVDKFWEAIHSRGKLPVEPSKKETKPSRHRRTIKSAILDAIESAIEGATGGANLGAILGTNLGAIWGAIWGAILGGILGAIWGAIEGAKEVTKRGDK
ncbi:MAG: protein kinase [Armatimonadetes bacterium]|nr:protein kinase [Armatimonadota bacterium]